MNETKRIINDYEIIQSFYVGEKEVVVGENKNAEYKYICGYYESNEIFERINDCRASNDYLDDERVNLNRQLSQPILIIGDLGLWNGRANGYKMIDSGNLKDCLYTNSDMAEWYVDKRGDLRCDAVHHDGTNHYLYRVFKDGVSETQIENLQNKIYFGKATRADITRVTRRLGDEINKVYNIDLPFAREKQPREIER